MQIGEHRMTIDEERAIMSGRQPKDKECKENRQGIKSKQDN